MILDIKFSDVLLNVSHLIVVKAARRISAPDAELNIFEEMLLVRCGILTIENRRLFLLS